jgi:hypothetical protein
MEILPQKLVGVHYENRNVCGVNAPEIHRLGADIVCMGWSSAATSHAGCAEDTSGKIENLTNAL